MELNQQVQAFGKVCEHLLFEISSSLRSLTDDEALFVKYYCSELIDKLNGVPSQSHTKPAPPAPPSTVISD